MTCIRSSFARALLLIAIALYALLLHAPRLANAQATCVPEAIGVPGQPGPPAWWGGGSGATDDPRWQGSMSFGHANDDAQFRALKYTDSGQKYLVLSWEVKADSGGAATGSDYLYAGFWDPATSKGNIIKLTRNTTSSVSNGTFAAGAFTAEVRYRDSGTGGNWNLISAIPPAPAWLQSDALIDTSCIAGPPPLCTRWSVRMRVPIGAASPVNNPSAGLPIPDAFSMWYELHVEDAGPSIVRYKFPSTAPNVIDVPLTFPDPTSTTQWQSMSAANSGSCSLGVHLDYAQITTDNASENEVSTTHANVFHARPTNDTGASIPGNNLRARFRIANWGSVLFDSPEWLDISPSSPSCATATGPGGLVSTGTQFDLSCSWTLTPTQQCEYRPDVHNTCSPMPAPRNKHQCVLVELSSTTGVFFSRQSAWNNMNFVTTSKFERAATISVKGLPPLSGVPQRDVYLYVTTQNLPAPPSQQREAGGKPPLIHPVGTKEGARLQELVIAGKLSFAELSAKMPTYVVRPYYDTGVKEKLAGVDHVVLEPMPSYGYYVMHDGDIEGWKHSLTGAVEISPSFYKLGVPHGGSADVGNAIESVEPGAEPPPPNPTPTPEPPPPPPANYWWIFLVLALLIIVILLARKKP
jgi:hypothetical protein